MSIPNNFYLDLGFAIKEACNDRPLEKEFSIVYSTFSNSETFVGETLALALSEKPEYYVSDMDETWEDKFVESFRKSKATKGELCFTDKETGCYVEAKFFYSICLILWTNAVGGMSISCIDLTKEV